MQSIGTELPISKYFSLADLTSTSQKISNQPDSVIVLANLRTLSQLILDPLYEHFGTNLELNSVYRSPEVNKNVGGSAKSQHVLGQAADFEVRRLANYDLALWVQRNLPYGQLILEHFIPEVRNSGWVHCSYTYHGRQVAQTKFKASKTLYDGILLKVPGKSRESAA